MKSFTFYITTLVIRIKGIKNAFSQDPVDFVKLRKDDVHTPGKKDTKGLAATNHKIKETTLTCIDPANPFDSNTAIFYCPGGAFVYGPTQLNWHFISRIVKRTGIPAWLADYPKAPETEISRINENIDAVYQFLQKEKGIKNLILVGDSVGATLMLLLLQRLIKAKEALPDCLFLISPVMDASLSNPRIPEIERKDLLLCRAGALSAKKMCVRELPLTSPEISPLYGDVTGFVKTYIYIAENDIMQPDTTIFIEKLKKENIDVKVTEGKGMPHIWPLLPLMREAGKAVDNIVKEILSGINEQSRKEVD